MAFQNLFANNISCLLKRPKSTNRFFSFSNSISQQKNAPQKAKDRSHGYPLPRSIQYRQNDAVIKRTTQDKLQQQRSASSLNSTLLYTSRECKVYSDYCCECHQKFSDSRPLLERTFIKNRFNTMGENKQGDCCCVGCKRLFGKHIHNHQIKNAIKSEILLCSAEGRAVLDGMPIIYHFHFSSLLKDCNESFVYSDRCLKYAKRLRRHMKERYKKRYNLCNGDNLYNYYNNKVPSISELVQLIQKSGNKCAITGITGTWLSNTLDPFRLTIDHILPIAKDGSFGKENLQVVLHCINQTKGNSSDSEVIEYIDGFKCNALQTLMSKLSPYYNTSYY